VQTLRRWQGSRLAVAGLAVAAVLFLAVNIAANGALRGVQLDLTENRLYTLSDGTRRTLAGIDEPITVRLYFSKNLAEAAPRYGAYYARVRELLQRYADLARGKLRLELLDPEPFSDAEDRAVADGLQGVPVTQAGDLGYFGLAADNATDGRAAIGFFNLEREPFLEYDLTKLIYSLAKSELPKLGLINTLPPAGGPGGFGAPTAEPMILAQLQEFFTVERLETDLAAVPANIDVLVVIDPARLGADALRAIDRFVHGGGRAMVFADPHLESAQTGAPETEASAGDLDRLLAAWGVRLVSGKVAGDLDAARRVSTGARGSMIGDYVAWLGLGAGAFEAADPVFSNVERLNFASAGILEAIAGATTTVSPLVQTGPRAMAIDVERIRFMPDISRLLREFRPAGQRLVLAARIRGPARAAFADPQPEPAPQDTRQAEGAQDARPIDVIVVADADLLFDRFWVTSADFFGEQVLVPQANNADFVINAVENLSGSEALIGLRGRGSSYRPFTLIEAFRREAEMQYRTKEQELQSRLRQLEGELKGLRRGGEDGRVETLLTAEDKAAIERFRGEILGVRRELRDVQHALRRDIEGLERLAKLTNIAAVPALVCIAGVILTLWRRARRRRRGIAAAPPAADGGATSR
jgi:ABC-type uncharacterized transport system involved in gliding motility auxiliary subunit